MGKSPLELAKCEIQGLQRKIAELESKLHEAATKLAEKEAEKGKLQRSSIEAYSAIIIAVLLAVFPMTWYLRLLLFLILATVCVDFCWRSPITYKRDVFSKILLCVLVVGVVSWFGIPNVSTAYKDDHFPPHIEYMARWGESFDRNGCQVVVNGTKLTRYEKKYHLWVACFHPGLLDHKDAPVSGSALFDIEPSVITLTALWSEEYIRESQLGAQGTYYVLFLIPQEVNNPAFSTERDAINHGGIVLETTVASP
jgi:hypothetical protein